MSSYSLKKWLLLANRIIFATVATWMGTRIPAAETNGAALRVATASSEQGTNSPFKSIGPSLLELGKIQINTRQRTITCPAVVNLRDVNVEYLLVSKAGKTHESLLRTDAEPMHLQLALLLLAAKGAGTSALPEDSAQPLPGQRITIQVQWSLGSTNRSVRAEELILDLKAKTPATKGPWIYTGSRLREDGFAAQLDGSIVSLITDPEALINNPRPGREDDDNWKPNAALLPSLNTPVQVTFRLNDTP